jgi:hypothetical protein
VALRSQKIYVTSFLILFMLATVCQSNSRFAMCSNTNCAVWGLCGDNGIAAGVREHCSAGKVVVACYVRTRVVPLLLISSNMASCTKNMVLYDYGLRYHHCSCASLAIESDQVTLQIYSEVCFLLFLTTGLYPIINLHMLISLIHKLIISTISTGVLTFVFAAVVLVVFLSNNQSKGERIWIS